MAARNEREYIKRIDDDALRVRFTTQRGRVVAFTVQGEVWINERYWPVVRYDTAHGRAHRDLLDWSGRTVEKEWLPAPLDRDFNAALTFAGEDVVTNWDTYRDAFMRREP